MKERAIKGAADAYAMAYFQFMTADPDEPVPYNQARLNHQDAERRLDDVIKQALDKQESK